MRASVQAVKKGEKTMTQSFAMHRKLVGWVCRHLWGLGTCDGICKAAVIASQQQAVGRGGEVAVSTWSHSFWDDMDDHFVSCWKELKTGHDAPMIYCIDSCMWEIDVLVNWAAMLIVNNHPNDRGKFELLYIVYDTQIFLFYNGYWCITTLFSCLNCLFRSNMI